MSYIEIRQVVKSFGDNVVLKNISMDVEKGELVTLLGPSGCGKSTLLRAIAGLTRVNEGTVLIDGEDVTALDARLRQVGMVFQSYALFPNMTAAQNIAFGLTIQKKPQDEINERVAKMIELVGLKGRERHRPSQLSGGQQQRVALARALIMEPKVLLLDEPLSALDAQIRQNLRVQIREIQQSLHITAIFVTHDQEEAMAVSDRIFVMDNGVIAQAGTPEDIYKNPDSEFVARFIGHYNVLSPAEAARVFPDETFDCKVVAIRPEVIGHEPGPDRVRLSAVAQSGAMLGSVMRYALVSDGVPLNMETVNHALKPISFGQPHDFYVHRQNILKIKA